MTFLLLLRTVMKQRGLGEGKESGEERLLAGGGAALPNKAAGGGTRASV